MALETNSKDNTDTEGNIVTTYEDLLDEISCMEKYCTYDL